MYAVNHIRGVRADEIPDPVKTVQDFHDRVFFNSYNFHFPEKSSKMKAGVWYVLGFLVMFIYFYVYAVNYIRGVRADEIPDPVKTVQDFHDRVAKQLGKRPPPNLGVNPSHQLPLPALRQQQSQRRNDGGVDPRTIQKPVHPR